MGKERMKLEKQTLYIRVPMELDHHSARRHLPQS